MILVPQTIVSTKVADPLVSIKPFTSSHDLRFSDVVHCKMTNSLILLLQSDKPKVICKLVAFKKRKKERKKDFLCLT